MIARVQAAIARHRLILPGDHIVLAVSGGADSTGLVRVLAELREPLAFSMSLLHVHHGIRGAAADADEAFVQDLAAVVGVELDTQRVDVPAAVRASRDSLEMAARTARLQAYASIREARSAAAVATGHTRDDRVETLLLRLLRGGGGTGLSGMRPSSQVHGVHFIRPLLRCTRGEVEKYLNSRGQDWRTDLSNADIRFLRNRVRHELLPWLRDQFNPSVAEALARTAELLDQDEALLDALGAEALSRCRTAAGLDATRVQAEPPALAGRLVRRWLMDEGVAGDAVNRALLDRIHCLMVSTRGTASVPLPGGGAVERTYGTLRVLLTPRPPAEPFSYELGLPGQVSLPACGLQARSSIEPADQPRRAGQLAHWPAEACLQRSRIPAGPLILRSRRPGDKMRPLGLGGTVKLKDMLINAKIPRDLRDQIPVCEYRGEIIWVPGYRVAEGWEVLRGDTECVQVRIEALSH